MATPDMPDERSWPAALLDAAEVRGWIAHVLPRQPRVRGPLVVYQAKEWGVTARFAVDSEGAGATQEVVFKASLLPLFRAAPYVESLLARHCPGAVPDLLGWERRGPGAWMLYAPFAGVSVSVMPDLEPLLVMARTLAAIQSTLAALPETELAPLPRVPLGDVPAMFDIVLTDTRARHLSFWKGEGSALAEQFGLRADVADEMERYRPAVVAWVDELAAGGWPLSLDHVDLQVENAVIQPNGDILLYDWEEANLSCPYFSLDRLLDDAFERAGDAGTQRLRAAYIEALPWSSLVERARALDLALCLSPLKHAYEALQFADALGWSEGAPLVTAWALARALPRWRALV